MNSWKEMKISQLGRVITGKTPPTGNLEYFGGTELFVSPKDLEKNSYYVYETQTRITEKALEKFKNQVLPKNSVMFTSLSYSFGKMGITSQYTLTNQQINSVIVNKDNHFKFIYYLLRAYEPTIYSYNSGIDTPLVTKSVFESIKIKVPDKEIQEKIAAILAAYDDLVENNKRRISMLERMAEEIYQEWFIRLRFPGFQHAKFEKGIPEGWEVSRVDEIGRIVTGKTPSTEEKRYYGGEYHFIKTPDMHQNIFILSTSELLTDDGIKSQPKQTIPKNSICVSCIGTGGIVSIASETCQTNQQINSIVLKNTLDLEWAFFTIRNLKETVQLFGSTGTTMTNLSKSKFAALRIVCPDKSIRVKFHEKVSEIFFQIQLLGKKSCILVNTRNNLLRRLISGQLQVDTLDIQYSYNSVMGLCGANRAEEHMLDHVVSKNKLHIKPDSVK